jgi:hypothetical protein
MFKSKQIRQLLYTDTAAEQLDKMLWQGGCQPSLADNYTSAVATTSSAAAHAKT